MPSKNCRKSFSLEVIITGERAWSTSRGSHSNHRSSCISITVACRFCHRFKFLGIRACCNATTRCRNFLRVLEVSSIESNTKNEHQPSCQGTPLAQPLALAAPDLTMPGAPMLVIATAAAAATTTTATSSAEITA